MDTTGLNGAGCELAARFVEARNGEESGDRSERGELIQLAYRHANSQSTAKTMADGGTGRTFCTLPRFDRVPPKADEPDTSSPAVRKDHERQFYTLRPVALAGGRCAVQLSPAAVVAMGNVGGTRLVPPFEEDRPEVNRSLLYEQNMCTFENFCERRTSGPASERDTSGDGGTSAGEGLANFCTLRRGRREWDGGNGNGLQPDSTGNGGARAERQPLGGDYCTLKKKKLQLNRKFVESFLEDPNAQVADYLSELDAYLDEMDGGDDDDSGSDGSGESGEHSAGSSMPDVNVVEEKQSDRVTPWPDEVCSKSLQYYQAAPSERRCAGSERDGDAGSLQCPASAYQEDRIQFGDIKHFCTLPKQKRTQVLNAFKRGASLRRTIVGPSDDGERESGRIVPESGSADSGQSMDFNSNVDLEKMEPSTSAGFEELFARLAELEEMQLTIAESDAAIAALQTRLALHKQKHPGPAPPPLPFEQFRAFCLGWVRKCEAATEKIRHETRALVRANAARCALMEQKRQTLGSDVLRVHVEAFQLERRSGKRDLEAAMRTDYEFKRLGAGVKREMLREKLALFDATVRYGRGRHDLERRTAELGDVGLQIERAEREVALLERGNAQMRARLGKCRLPNVLDMAEQMEQAQKGKKELYNMLKQRILDGSIVIRTNGVDGSRSEAGAQN